MVSVFPACCFFLEQIMDKWKFVQVGDHVQLRVPKPSGLLKVGDVGLVVSRLQLKRTWMELQAHRKRHRNGIKRVGIAAIP